MTSAKPQTPTIQLVKISRLKFWDGNPRVRNSPEHIETLKASILANGGLLQNLIAVPSKDRDGDFIVIAGASRHRALCALIAEGKLPFDAAVPVAIRHIDIDDAEALMVALSENSVRAQLDVIDECAAMASLADRKLSVESIAAAFGYKPRTVRQRMALGRLPLAAKDMIRDKKRELEWGEAMTAADPALQERVIQEISLNPGAWRDGEEIRRYLRQDTIQEDHALFDKGTYKGRLIYDLFDQDRFADRHEFWDLQNRAIEQMKARYEQAGWSKVIVLHGKPVDPQHYSRTTVKRDGIVILQVYDNGKVITHEGLRPNQEEIEEIAEAEAEALADAFGEAPAPIAADGVRASNAVLEYAAAQRSALLQNAIAASPRKAMEIALIGLLGAAQTGIRAAQYRFPGAPETRNTPAFHACMRTRDEVEQVLQASGVDLGAASDADLLAMAESLSDAELAALFAKAVSMKIGQTARRIDADPGSLSNLLGRSLGINVRAGWTPDESFFSLMQTEDLRRLGTALLPPAQKRGLLSAKKRDLVKMLTDAFADAAEAGGTMAPAERARLNAWTPGPMAFPAADDADRPAEAGVEAGAVGAAEDEEVDVVGAMFAGLDEQAA